jgi:hypothetical protein
VIARARPLLGTIIVIGGMAIVVFGLVLAIANLIVWTARRRSNKG